MRPDLESPYVKRCAPRVARPLAPAELAVLVCAAEFRRLADPGLPDLGSMRGDRDVQQGRNGCRFEPVLGSLRKRAVDAKSGNGSGECVDQGAAGMRGNRFTNPD